MSREQLFVEVQKLRQGIRRHRDSTLLHELCWHHPELWGLLPERTDPVPVVPDWPQWCLRYRRSLDEQAPEAPRNATPYAVEECRVRCAARRRPTCRRCRERMGAP